LATVAGLHVEVADLPGDSDCRALVLLHEGLGSVGLWRDFPQALHAATGRRVVAFSRFGHGRSDPPRAPRTPAFFHEETQDVLPALLSQLDAPEPRLVRRLARSRHARLEPRARGGRLVVPGGHSPHLEQAEAVVEAIAAFARGLP
jgi:pimeloyl-ACP methyl ester carboxylesterase